MYFFPFCFYEPNHAVLVMMINDWWCHVLFTELKIAVQQETATGNARKVSHRIKKMLRKTTEFIHRKDLEFVRSDDFKH